jgi:type I restriction-modification system DNA methylase subunit
VVQNGTLPMFPREITLAELESHLWESANILRGPVDAADFKSSIFPLLFFKRISDVHDEEYAEALAESGGDEEYARFPQNYRFQVPPEAHWQAVRQAARFRAQAAWAPLQPEGGVGAPGAPLAGRSRRERLHPDA